MDIKSCRQAATSLFAFGPSRPGKPREPIEGHAGEVLSVAFSPDGKRALSGSADKTVKLWDVETGDLLRTFEGHSDDVLSVAFSSDGKKALSASKDKTLKLWDTEAGQLLKTLEGHADAVTSAALLADGEKALSGSRDKTIKLWDLATGQPLRTFEGHSDEVLSVARSSDGRVLSASKDKTLKLWDAKTGQLIKTFEGHSDSVTSVVVSPDGQNALSGSWDKTLRVWDLGTGQIESTIDVQSTTFWPSGYRNFFSGVSLTKKTDPALVEERLKEKGLKRGAPVFLRIFKGDLEAELWMKRGDRYELFATYPICAWSGQLGPKVREGDLQAPEGFYTIGKGQLNPNSHYHRAFNLGYPNDLDRAHNRTGANLMIHGGCGSVGCFAMTDAEIDELWLLVTAALDNGQERVPVACVSLQDDRGAHGRFCLAPLGGFLARFEAGLRFFEKSHTPPRISVCNKRYSVQGRTEGGWTPVSQSECPARRGGSLPLP